MSRVFFVRKNAIEYAAGAAINITLGGNNDFNQVNITTGKDVTLKDVSVREMRHGDQV